MESRTAVAVAMGGAVGAGCRWGLGEAFGDADGWPWAIFSANIVGCLALGVLVGGFRRRLGLSVFVGATTGFCGALTTFSAFAVDVAVFLRDDRWALLMAYLLTSVVAGLSVFVLGRMAGSRLHTWAGRR